MTDDKPESITMADNRDRTARQLAATAHHEAGHAFFDWKFHFKIKQVTIVPGDGSLGTATTKYFQFRRLESEGSTMANRSGVTMIELSHCLPERKHSGGLIQKASENTMPPVTMIR